MRSKVIQTFSQRGLQIAKTTNVSIRRLAQFSHVITKGCQFNVERLIRTPARQHVNVKGVVFRNRGVVFQRIDWIVGRTCHFHIHLPHDTTRGEGLLRQQRVALLPNFIRGSRRQQGTSDAKRTA